MLWMGYLQLRLVILFSNKSTNAFLFVKSVSNYRSVQKGLFTNQGGLKHEILIKKIEDLTLENLKFRKNTTILLTVPEAAEFLRCSEALLNRWRVEGDGPHFLKIGRKVLYKLDHLLKYLEQSERTSTSDNPKRKRGEG